MLHLLLLCLLFLTYHGSTLSVTLSMKDYVSRAFKSAISVRVPSVPSLVVSILSVPSFLPSSSFHMPLCEDGSIDWIKECQNRQLLYQESLACYMKMRKKKYHYEYSPSKSRQSTWYKEYVLNVSGKLFTTDSRKAIKFRRRFRLPFSSFNDLMADIRAEKWFPNNEVCDCRGVLGVPIGFCFRGPNWWEKVKITKTKTRFCFSFSRYRLDRP